MAYVDGFLIPVPTENKEKYIAFSKKWTQHFKEWGALSIYECWGEDVPPGKLTSFPLAVDLSEDETVVFSWTVWPDKPTRDAAWKKIQEFPEPDEIPFDGKRMIFGGFEPVHVVE